MKLADFLFSHQLSPSVMRRRLGIKQRSTMWRYLTHERIPQPQMLLRIEEETRGAVTIRDFLDQTPPECIVRVVIREDGTSRWVLPWSAEALRDPRTTEAANDTDQRAPVAPTMPVQQALEALGPSRASFNKRGTCLLDGRTVDIKVMIRAANDVLRARGQETIRYPGVENSDV